MLIKRIKDYLLLGRPKLTGRSSAYPGFKRLKHIDILFESGDYDSQILDFARRLEGENKKVNLLGYLPKKEKDLSTRPDYPHFLRNEVNWLGKPQSDSVSHFMANSSQVLILLSAVNEGPLRYVTAHSQADFVIGVDQPSLMQTDLRITAGPGLGYEGILKEIEYYLKFINSEDSLKEAVNQ